MKSFRLITAIATTALVLTAAQRTQAEKPNIVTLAAGDANFSTLVAALKAADLVDVVKDGTFTVFAPTNEAFEKLPKGSLETLLKPENQADLQNILKYHVIPGSGYDLASLLERGEWGTANGKTTLKVAFRDGRVRVNDAVLQTSDIACANGTVHVIDQVMLPPNPSNTIVDVAANAGSFSTLLTAAKAAGLADALAGEGPFTVFAPTDDAFAKVPKKILNDILKPENKDQLVNLLKYHVVPGRVSAGDALNAKSATTLNDKSLPIAFSKGALRAQWAKVLEADIEAENGLIHVIDSVLLPPGKKSAKNDGLKKAYDTIVAAVDKGVPMYNHGDSEGCAALYMKASKQLLAIEGLPGDAEPMLRKLVSKASNSHCATTRAWTLRAGLDHTYAALKHAMSNERSAN